MPITAGEVSSLSDMGCSLSSVPPASVHCWPGREHGRTIPLAEIEFDLDQRYYPASLSYSHSVSQNRTSAGRAQRPTSPLCRWREVKIMKVTQYLAKDLFKGKTVFVTGGGSGINLGVAKNFAALGASIAICGRTQEKLDAAAEELRALGAKVCPVAADVRDIAALDAAFARSRAELGSMDVLICGAAGNFLAPAEKLSANGFKTVIDIDLLGSFNASRAAFEQLKETKGALIYISAGMAYMPHAFQVHVGAAKAGINMMMKNLDRKSRR